MKSKFIRILIYGILIWAVSASYSHYVSTTSAGRGDWPGNGAGLFASIYEKIVPGSLNIRARAALAVDAETGEIYFSKNKDKQMPIASLTKLATALVFFETNPDLSGAVTTIESDFAGVNRSKLYPGETIKLIDCLHLSLMCSDNAAMRALARSTGLSGREFVKRMNDLAGSMEMGQTHFTDPTGLDAGNLSTAADYVKLLRNAYLNETISKISAKKSYQFTALNRNITHTLYNTNRLLYSRWDVRGGKTGYISQAGYCLALDLYDNSGRRINAVVLGSPSNQYRYRDADRLLAYATHN